MRGEGADMDHGRRKSHTGGTRQTKIEGRRKRRWTGGKMKEEREEVNTDEQLKETKYAEKKEER